MHFMYAKEQLPGGWGDGHLIFLDTRLRPYNIKNGKWWNPCKRFSGVKKNHIKVSS